MKCVWYIKLYCKVNLSIKRSQLRWFEHLVRMHPGYLTLEVFQARPTGRRPQGDPEHPGGITYFSWPWNTLGSPGGAVAGEKIVWVPLLSLIPL